MDARTIIAHNAAIERGRDALDMIDNDAARGYVDVSLRTCKLRRMLWGR